MVHVPSPLGVQIRKYRVLVDPRSLLECRVKEGFRVAAVEVKVRAAAAVFGRVAWSRRKYARVSVSACLCVTVCSLLPGLRRSCVVAALASACHHSLHTVGATTQLVAANGVAVAVTQQVQARAGRERCQAVVT